MSSNRQHTISPAGSAISEEQFRDLVTERCAGLLRLARFITLHDSSTAGCYTRPLLADLLTEASTTEELLDAYGARRNTRWKPLRQLIAPVKLFSDVAYVLRHIRLFLPSYRLLDIEGDFAGDTDRAFAFTCTVLSAIARSLIDRARQLGVTIPQDAPQVQSYVERLPTGTLPADLAGSKTGSPERTVVYLSTAFLNLAEDTKFLHIESAPEEEYEELFPEPLNEERLRELEGKFHNLQSRYDTFVSDSNMEIVDPDLSVLRGHISVIYHLLETATAFAHYYERHLWHVSAQPSREVSECVDEQQLLRYLMHYSIGYTSRYIVRTRELCHRMLRRYSVKGEIEVPVPRYRGFHVRPSTLIAKIVNHYGSEVEMQMDAEVYDAGVTLDLFRANEKLNAYKRRRIAENVHRVFMERKYPEDRDLKETIREVVRLLFERGKIVLYFRKLPDEDVAPIEDESLEQTTIRALNRLLTLGKIDVEMDATARFVGDRRVLADIELLAQHGYGEDEFGNNLPLPPPLAYLRK